MSFVRTVLGDIPASELGVTLPHEHFYCTTAAANLAAPDDPRDRELARQPVSLEIRDWLEYNWHFNRDNLTLDDTDTACDEGRRYREAGGRSVIDVTPWGIGRNPAGLAEIAKRTGLHVVMGCGHYASATHPSTMATTSQSAITDRIVAEFIDGVEGTGIHPGVIGEIGCSWPLAEAEEKSLRAAGEAQKILAAALYIHPGKHPDAVFQIVGILEEIGTDMSRVIMCHMDRTVRDIDQIISLLRSGCTGEWDLFGMETTGLYYRPLCIDMMSDAQRLILLRILIDAGFLDRILISQDVCFKHRLHKYGGNGYDHILRNTVPWMRMRGFTTQEIDTIMIDNPCRLIGRQAA
jgi:phosphotriesterase-related protein